MKTWEAVFLAVFSITNLIILLLFGLNLVKRDVVDVEAI